MAASPTREAAAALRRLRHILGVIGRIDPSHDAVAPAPAGPDTPELASRYARRNTLVLAALALARQGGLDVGVGYDTDASHPVVVYLQLPTGQVSWHLPAHPIPWDGHTTTQKYDRIAAFLRQRPT